MTVAVRLSPLGLVVTNHHCAYGAIQYNSTEERNLLRDGFLARENAQELPAGPGSRVFVTIDFSASMDAASIDESTLVVLKDGAPVPGVAGLAPNDVSAHFRPDAPLDGETNYEIRVAASVRDRFGNALTRIGSEHPLEETGAKLRALMPWLGQNKLVDRERN